MINAKLTERGLLDGGFTCAVYCGEEIFKSTERGVAPLRAWLKDGKDFRGFSAVDKVVGKAAAFLYVLLGVEKVYAFVISESAAEVFTRFHVEYHYGEKVVAIRNRTNTGYCPMEQAVLDITDPQTAYARIPETLRKLKEQK